MGGRRAGWVLLVAAFSAGMVARAGSQVYDLMSGDAAPLVVQLTGAQRLTCHSQWHNIAVKSTIGGCLSLSVDDLRALTARSAAVKDTWEVPEAVVCGIGERLFRAIRLTHDDPASYSRWRGSGPFNEHFGARGKIKAELASVEATDPGAVARIKLAGALELEEGGHMRSRYGPNAWKARWQLPLTGSLDVDLAARKVVRVALSSEGSITGGYGPEGNGFTDPWRADIQLELRAGELPADAEKRLQRLIAELGHEEFARRERATQDAAKLEPSLLAVLIARLEGSDDPELRYRASLLKPPSPKPPRGHERPDGTIVVPEPIQPPPMPDDIQEW